MNREAVKEQARKSIDNVFDEIKKLEAKKDNISTEAAVRVNREIESLKKEKTELEQKYKTLQTASEEKWNEAKSDFNSSMESFKAGVNKLTQILN